MGIKVQWKNKRDFNDWRVKGLGEHGVTKYEDLLAKPGQQIKIPIKNKKYLEWGRFDTPTGKIELYNTSYKKAGYPPLPQHVEPPESPVRTPDIFREYPFIAVSHREKYNDATMSFQPGTICRKFLPDQVVEMNRAVAEKMGIKEGEWLEVSRKGYKHRVHGRARLTNMQPNTVSMIGHYWYPEMPGPDYGVKHYNINMLTNNKPPYSFDTGCPNNRNILVKVKKAEAFDAKGYPKPSCCP
jgi:anaerobic selenocysteine-containing dehydrogenase